MDKTIRVAILGCGQITKHRHVPEYRANPFVTLVGFYDQQRERAEHYATLTGGKVYDTPEALFTDPTIDAVSVCTPNQYHAEHTIRALEAGKHVLCEKPMSTSLAESRAMIEAEDAAGKLLMLGMNQRLVPSHIKAREFIRAGILGDVLAVTTNFKHSGPENWTQRGNKTWFFDKEKAGFGAIGDLGAHKFDLVRFLLDTDVDSVQATLVALDKNYPNGELIDVDDNAICLFKTKSGAIGTLYASWTNYGREDNSTVIYGTLGTMKILSQPDYDLILELGSDERYTYQLGQIATNKTQLPSGVIDAFVDAIRGVDTPLATSHDGLHTQACIEAAQKSVESKRWEKVEI